MADVPKLYRVSIQVGDLDEAATFYSKLLGSKGRRIHGARHYFDCGPVILAVIDPSAGGTRPKPNADHIYFAVRDVKKVHARARSLKCLSKEDVHGDPAGKVVVRPWGERSFYADDPWGNPLCFVDEKTLFLGREPSRRPRA